MTPMATHIMLELGDIKWNKTEITAAEEIWRRCGTLTEDAQCRKKWKEAKKVLKEQANSVEDAKNHMKETIKEANDLLKKHQVVPAWRKTEEIVTEFAEKYKIVDASHPTLRQIWPLQCKISAQMKKWDDVIKSCENVIKHIKVVKGGDKSKAAAQKKRRAFAYYKAAKAYLSIPEPKPAKCNISLSFYCRRDVLTK